MKPKWLQRALFNYELPPGYPIPSNWYRMHPSQRDSILRDAWKREQEKQIDSVIQEGRDILKKKNSIMTDLT